MKITNYSDIDTEKLYLKTKPINPLLIGFFRNAEAIIDGTRDDSECHQCSCGKLIIMPNEDFKKLREKFGTDEIPCPSCGKYEDKLINISTYTKFMELTETLRKYEKVLATKKKKF